MEVSEFSSGDMNDGYILYDTPDPVTGLYVSYPKFTSAFGANVSFKYGIWDGSQYQNKLKIINLPVLKSHQMLGVTECVKHYMGVQSESKFSPGLANGHDTIKYGGMGTLMAEVGLPTLNIVDAIWVNAHPEYGLMGPDTPYSSATRVNVLAASVDPVALSYWSAKHILMPTASTLGYSDVRTLDPDDTDLTAQRNLSPYLEETFGTWLSLAMDQLTTAGYNVTNDENQMNVYVRAHMQYTIDVPFGSTPTIDGQIPTLDGEWSDAYTLTLDKNASMNWYTDVYIKQDGKSLYAGLVVNDSSPSLEDKIAFFMDVNHDEGDPPQNVDILLGVYRNGAPFELRGEELPSSPTGGWTVAVQENETRWMAEYNITFPKIEIEPGEEKTIGALFSGYEDIHGGVYYWPPGGSPHNCSTWGDLTSGNDWIPEFPFTMVISLLFTATLFAAVAYRRARTHSKTTLEFEKK